MGEPHVVSALRDKRAELSGVIADLERRIGRHRADLAHLDATLRLFAPEIEPATIAPRRPRRRNAWFRPGECSRLVLDVLRTAAGRALDTREIAQRLMAAKGLDPADAPALELIRKTVLGTLNRAGDLIERIEGGPGGPVSWRLVD